MLLPCTRNLRACMYIAAIMVCLVQTHDTNFSPTEEYPAALTWAKENIAPVEFTGDIGLCYHRHHSTRLRTTAMVLKMHLLRCSRACSCCAQAMSCSRTHVCFTAQGHTPHHMNSGWPASATFRCLLLVTCHMMRIYLWLTVSLLIVCYLLELLNQLYSLLLAAAC